MKKQSNYTEDFAKKFKKSYRYKMGGTQTIIFPNGQKFFFDDREYYKGRGAKFNNSVKHDDLGEVSVSAKQVAAAKKIIREYERGIREVQRQKREDKRRYQANKKLGIYGVADVGWTYKIELSEEEVFSKTFDEYRLAKTLDISIEDARLLNSQGKTYVFAKQLSTGKIIELYHPSLDCNYLSITFNYVTEDEAGKFNHDEWMAAPYAKYVGMTENKNHFVC